ncbi:MAG TPA: hypothetical protein VFS43_10345, partial [Polyangiaceae bacterium]|nr:hypothetical protein [Polyangiaceae bacterium]
APASAAPAAPPPPPGTPPPGAPPPATAGAPAEAGGAPERKLTTIPTTRGLPVLVRVAIFFLELKSFDDAKGEFEATTDVRLRWTDPRLRFTPGEGMPAFREYRGSAAEAQLAGLWTPHEEVTNRIEAAPYVGRRLRVFANGEVETITRTTAKYRAKVDAEKFPFDRQRLTLDVIIREETTDEVLLEVQRDDVEFSRAASTLELDGWTPSLVTLKTNTVAGWNGDRYSGATASLAVDRVPSTAFAPIFIPLIASLLIPLLAIWMNKANDDGFEIEAFELANVTVGGLFSVIGLSFAVYSSYGVISQGDNTVSRLFGLNYVTLAASLGVVILFFRFNVPRRLFGPYVQEELFEFLLWALPVLALGASIAFVLVAAA